MTVMRCTPWLLVPLLAGLEASAQTPARLPVNPSGAPLPGPGIPTPGVPTPGEQTELHITLFNTPISSSGEAVFCVEYSIGRGSGASAMVTLESDGVVRTQRRISGGSGYHNRECIPLHTTIVLGSDAQDTEVVIRTTTTDPRTRLTGTPSRTFHKRSDGAGGVGYL